MTTGKELNQPGTVPLQPARDPNDLWLARLPWALRRLRQNAGLSPKEVVKVARQRSSSLTTEQVLRWERGKGCPSVRTLFVFLAVIEADPNDLAEALTGSDSGINFPETDAQELRRNSILSLSSLDERLMSLETQLNQLRAMVKADR